MDERWDVTDEMFEECEDSNELNQIKDTSN